jgi:hypothetical protein
MKRDDRIDEDSVMQRNTMILCSILNCHNKPSNFCSCTKEVNTLIPTDSFLLKIQANF